MEGLEEGTPNAAGKTRRTTDKYAVFVSFRHSSRLSNIFFAVRLRMMLVCIMGTWHDPLQTSSFLVNATNEKVMPLEAQCLLTSQAC